MDFMFLKKQNTGVPTVAQWVKNPTAAAQVAAKVWDPSPARYSGLKDPLWGRSQL